MPTYDDAWTDIWDDFWGTVEFQPGDLPEGALPAVNVTTRDVLYGSRTTRYRYELLQHNQSTGRDSLLGYLDGVIPGGQLDWQWNQAVKGTGTLNVLDIDQALPGKIRIADVDLSSIRIRPVLLIDGLPEIPLSLYLVTAAPEAWTDGGRTYALELHDRTTVLDQDQVATTFTAKKNATIMTVIASLISSAGETFAPDGSETRKLTADTVWPVGTTKLQIVNDLLTTLHYNALTVDGRGDFVATPYTSPADRQITYGLLNGIPRELVDGESSIYQPDWSRVRDVYGVPNKVVVIGNATGSDAPPLGSYTNTDPDSPFSYAARGRWIVYTVQGIDVPTLPTGTTATDYLNAVARATLISLSSPQVTVTVKHLPLPLTVGDVVRFASAPAGIDTRHIVVGITLELSATGLMQSNLQEVIDL